MLDHYILLNKLKFYGVSSTPLKWFQSYLHGRKQYVDFDEIHSNTGPLLFIIFMNDIYMASQNFSRTLGIMCHLKNFLPTHVLSILYNFLILPHLQYSILAWGFRMGRLEEV